MRKSNVTSQFLVCFALVWVSLTMAVTELEKSLPVAANAAVARTQPASATYGNPSQINPLPGMFLSLVGPDGGTTSTLVQFPDGHIMAGTAGGGAFYTMDSGESWVQRNNGLTNLFVNSLLLANLFLFAATTDGIFRSGDRGLTWTPISAGLTVLAILSLFLLNDILYAGSNGGGLFVSTNSGASWVPSNNGLTSLRINYITAVGTLLFLATAAGVFRSDNNGSSWFPVNNGLTVLTITVLTFIGGTLFAGTSGGGVFRSTNTGGSWSPVNVGLTSFFILSFFVLGTTLLVGTREGLFRSTNDGAAWTPLSLTGLTAITIRAILIVGGFLFAGTFGGGVFRSDNQGQSWVEKNRGLAAAEVRALDSFREPNCNGFAAQNCQTLFAVTLGGVFSSPSNGRTWTPINNGLNNPAARQGSAFLAAGNYLYLGTNDGVYGMPVGGTIWTRINSGITTPFITTFAATPNTVYAGTTDGVFFTVNLGATWTPINSGLTNRQVRSLTASVDTLYAGTNGGGVYELTGTTWQQRNDGLTDPGVSATEVIGGGGQTFALAGTSGGGIFRSKLPLLGSLWKSTTITSTQETILVFITPTLVNSEFTDGSRRPAGEGGSIDPAVQAQTSQLALAGTNGDGVLISTDLGETWTPFNDGLTDLNIFDLTVANGNLFAATSGGVYIFARRVASVSAASFVGPDVAAESIVAAFGTSLATGTKGADTIPLPTTLMGTQIKVRDRAGQERDSPIFFVSPSQANYQVPPGTGVGMATVRMISSDGDISSGTVNITAVAPGLFTANANGQGVLAALALRVKADGARTLEQVAQFDSIASRFVAIPIDLGPAGDQVFLVAFGTGIKNRSSLSAVTMQIGSDSALLSYAGPQGEFVGLDQINALLPRSLIGRGEVDVSLTVDGRTSNLARIRIK